MYTYIYIYDDDNNNNNHSNTISSTSYYYEYFLTSRMPTLGILIFQALQGVSGAGHSGESLGLGTPGSVWEFLGWALQGVYGSFWALQGVYGWALQEVPEVGQFRALWHSQSPGLGTQGVSGLGTPGSLSGWALKGVSSLGVDRARRRVPGEEKN